MKVNGKKLRSGDKVRIAQDCREVAESANATGQTATYIGLCFVTSGRRYRGPKAFPELPVFPKFTLEDGSEIWGFECFWIPLSDALEIEENLLNASLNDEDVQKRIQEENEALLAEPRITVVGTISSIRSFGKMAFIKMGGYEIICKESILGKDMMARLGKDLTVGSPICISGPEVETKSNNKQTMCAVEFKNVSSIPKTE